MPELEKKEVIKRFKVRYGDRYNYSKMRYINSSLPITITCKTHGDFEQTPNDHLRGSGCRECQKEEKEEQVINKFRAVHGKRYDYSKMKYSNNTLPITITCKIHGDFEQKPNKHLRGNGCRECQKEEKKEQVINKFRAVHGNRYDYSKMKYINSSLPITITCKTHGDFEQTTNDHLKGKGCKECKKPEKVKLPSLLYYLKIDNGKAYKIGITKKYSVEKSIDQKDLKRISILKIWVYQLEEDAAKEKRKLLNQYKEYKYYGDSLLLNGNTGLFNRDILALDI